MLAGNLIFIHFVAIYSFAAENHQKKSLKVNIFRVKVIHGHRCWHYQEARRQCLLW